MHAKRRDYYILLRRLERQFVDERWFEIVFRRWRHRNFNYSASSILKFHLVRRSRRLRRRLRRERRICNGVAGSEGIDEMKFVEFSFTTRSIRENAFFTPASPPSKGANQYEKKKFVLLLGTITGKESTEVYSWWIYCGEKKVGIALQLPFFQRRNRQYNEMLRATAKMNWKCKLRDLKRIWKISSRGSQLESVLIWAGFFLCFFA